MKRQLIFYTQSIIGMVISHFVPTWFFWPWIVISLFLGHQINKINYKNGSKTTK